MACRIISDADSKKTAGVPIINGISIESQCNSNSYSCTTKTNNNEIDNDNANKGNSTCVTKESYLSRLIDSDLDLTKTVIPARDCETLNHQIAGHARTGVLKHRLGFVLKQKQKPPLGEREVSFYRSVNDNSTPQTPERILLKKLIPKFFGVTNIESIQDGTTAQSEYLILEDIAQGFVNPCVVDVKIGVKTWDPCASEAKIAHEKTKYAGTKIPLGISITGMQYFDFLSKTSIKSDKEFGKNLNTDNIGKAFRDFLNEKTGFHKLIAISILEKLSQVQSFFSVQKDYAFYASSLLIVYDANYIAKLLQTNVQNEMMVGQGETTFLVNVDVDDWLRIKMIDFAHVFSSNGELLDDNYMFGLENLMTIISKIANE